MLGSFRIVLGDLILAFDGYGSALCRAFVQFLSFYVVDFQDGYMGVGGLVLGWCLGFGVSIA